MREKCRCYCNPGHRQEQCSFGVPDRGWARAEGGPGQRVGPGRGWARAEGGPGKRVGPVLLRQNVDQMCPVLLRQNVDQNVSTPDVEEPHNSNAVPAPGRNFDATPAASVPIHYFTASQLSLKEQKLT
jgi:hypothetical protein